jgi:HD-GYP domain-containing protein (c-di-GMP phosphodiesterase class II)
MDSMHATHCIVAGELARRLGLDEDVRDALLQVFERWDGKGDPGLRAGSEISRPVRLVQLADVIEVFHRAGGFDAAVAVARKRSGTQFDPALVRCFCDCAPALLASLASTSSWDAVIDAEPGLRRTLLGEELDRALEAIADFADLKSPYTLGHSHAVADLAAEAARQYGLPERELALVRRAAMVHDLGRLALSNAIWDKREPLTAAERERIRLHAYLSERMLCASSGLAPLGALAGQHHERLDGSGYPRGLKGGALSRRRPGSSRRPTCIARCWNRAPTEMRGLPTRRRLRCAARRAPVAWTAQRLRSCCARPVTRGCAAPSVQRG